MMKYLLRVVFLVFAQTVSAVSKQSLNGRWLLKDEANNYTDLNVEVPGGIYTDLMSNQILDDIYKGFNDIEYKWVARSNWTYYSTFQVDEGTPANNTINLVLDGVDTIAIIVINNEKVGTTENMFVRYIFDITDKVQLGGADNSIEVRFLSPIVAADQLAAKQEADYVVPPQCIPDSYKGECHVNYLRKIPASFSWDWGPAFPSVGIWKDIYLENYHAGVIRDVVIEVLEDGDNWILTIDTYLSAPLDVAGHLTFLVETEIGTITVEDDVTFPKPNEFGEVKNTTNITVPKDSVQTWWPNGYGKQPLYLVTVELGNSYEISSKEVTIGYRKIEICEDALDSGATFYFKVNNVSIFAMGANVIPFDILPEKSYNEQTLTRFLSDLAAFTDVNMLRVWGGGVYESDLFYQLADQYGLLIWQDFVFASSMYPANDEFLRNVQKEVNHQVKRIQSHASLALWSGNNENESNLQSGYFGTDDNFDLYKADYIKLYIDTVMTEMRRVTKNANFVYSSPTNGIGTLNDGYIAENPRSTYYGDVHHYATSGDTFDGNTYPIPRFASEYGFQALPSITSWLTVTDNITDLDINSDFMKHRQHHPKGNDPLKNLIDNQMELPSEDNEFYIEAFIYYNQIIQAMSIKIETEHYRLYMGRFDEKGQGYTMGALYWQLNDVWVAPSWSSVDYTGRWKMLHYFLPIFFSQELVSTEVTGDNEVTIFHILNKENGVGEIWINVTVYRWDSLTPVNVTQYTGEFEPLSVTEVAVLKVDQYLSDAGCGSLDEAKNNCFVHLAAGRGSITLTPSNYFYPSKLKEANIQQANLEIIAIDNFDAQGLRFLIALRADAPCLFVWLDSGEITGYFDQNGFNQHTLVSTVIFIADEPTTVANLKAALTVTHLKNLKYFQKLI